MFQGDMEYEYEINEDKKSFKHETDLNFFYTPFIKKLASIIARNNLGRLTTFVRKLFFQ